MVRGHGRTGGDPAAFAHLRVAIRFIGVPRAFIHDYGSWRDIDATLGLDAAGTPIRL